MADTSHPLDGYVWDHNDGPMIPAVVSRELKANGFRFGAPKPREGYSVEALRSFGIVGVYRPAAALSTATQEAGQ